MKKYTIQHVGYPIAGRCVAPEEWKEYSKHNTLTVAIKRIYKATAHLQYGQWDDHYRIIAPDGHVCTEYEKDLAQFKIDLKLHRIR